MFGKLTTCILLCITLVSCDVHDINNNLNNSKSDYTNNSRSNSDDVPIAIETA